MDTYLQLDYMGGIEIGRIFAMIMVMLTIILGGCDLFNSRNSSDFDRSAAPQVMFDKIISALDNKDSEQIKKLFAPNALTKTLNINAQIESLFELYQGKFVSNSHFNEGSSSGSRKENRYVYLFMAPIIQELVTSESVYSLSFNFIPLDEENPNDVGLWGVWLRTMDGDKIIKEVQVGIPYPGRGEQKV